MFGGWMDRLIGGSINVWVNEQLDRWMVGENNNMEMVEDCPSPEKAQK